MGQHICQWYIGQGFKSPKFMKNPYDSAPGKQKIQLKNGKGS